MTDDDLVSRIQQILVAAKRRARARFISDALIDEAARGLAPLLRELVREAVAGRPSCGSPMGGSNGQVTCDQPFGHEWHQDSAHGPTHAWPAA